MALRGRVALFVFFEANTEDQPVWFHSSNQTVMTLTQYNLNSLSTFTLLVQSNGSFIHPNRLPLLLHLARSQEPNQPCCMLVVL